MNDINTLYTGEPHNNDTIVLHLHNVPFSGAFVAFRTSVNAKLVNYTKRELERRCFDMWPEMFRTADERRALRRYDKLTLAVVLSQK